MRPIKRARLERQARQLSQQTLETLTGIPQPMISLAETGRFVPTARQLQRLADVLGVPPEELFKDVVILEPSR